MESNIYYQLAQTECALDRCKRKLFKKNVMLFGLTCGLYVIGKTLGAAVKKLNEAEKARDKALEEKDKALEELRLATQKPANATTHCEGHATLS